MVLSQTRIDDIKRRSREEVDRGRYPDGFPVLPPVPAARYNDQRFADLEASAVFGRSWLFVAHTDSLRNPGDYVLLDQIPKPIMVLRADDGVVRAFYNTCKHRGAALLAEAAGNTGRRLTCPYHSWVYSLEGELIGYPEANNFADLDRDCLALTPILCETWGPLVFINLDPHANALTEYLADVGRDLSGFETLDGRLHLAAHTVRDVAVNWKIPVDANIETYHVNVVHRDTAAKALAQAATGIQLLEHGHSRMLVGLRDGIDLEAGLRRFPPVIDGVGDLPLAGTFSYHVFPNLSIVFSGHGFVFFITNWPTGPSSSSYHVHWCSSLSNSDSDDQKANEAFIAFNQMVLFEDLTVLPGIQASIDAGALGSIRLSYQERRIYHVHEAIDRAIGAERVAEELRVVPVLGPYVER